MSRLFYRKVFAIPLSLIVIVGVLLFSHLGNKLLIKVGQSAVSGLTIELANGSLFFSPRFNTIEFKQPSQHLLIESLAINWRWGCAWDSALCVEKLNAKRITLTQTEVSKDAPQHTKALERITLPFAIELQHFSLDHFVLVAPQHTLKVNQLATAISMENSSVEVNSFSVDTVYITQAQPAVPPKISTPKPPLTTTQPYQLVDLSFLSKLSIPSIPLDITLNRVSVQKINASLQQQRQPSPIEHELTQLSLQATVNEKLINIESFKANHSLAKLALNAKITLGPLLPHELAIDIQSKQKVELAGLVINKSTLSLQSSGQLDDLTLAVVSEGAISSKLNAQVNLLNKALPFTLDIDWKSAQVPYLEQMLIIDDGHISSQGVLANFDYKAKGGINFPQLPKVKWLIAGQGSPSKATLTLGEITTLDGTISAVGQLQWLKKLSWNGELALNNISPHKYWPQHQGKINGEISSKLLLETTEDKPHWTVDISRFALNGHWLNKPLVATGQAFGRSAVKAPYGQWHINQLILNAGKSELMLDGTIDQQFNIASKVTIDSFSDLLPQLEGSAKGTLAITGAIRAPKIEHQLTVEDFSDSESKTTIARIDSEGLITLDSRYPLSITSKIKKLRLGDITIQSADLQLNGDLEQHQLSLKSIGAPWEANLQLTGSMAEQWQGQLEQAKIRTPFAQWQLTQSTALSYSMLNNIVNLSQHCWQQLREQGANICLDNDLSVDVKNFKSNQGNISVNNFSLAQINKHIAKDIILSGDASLAAQFTLTNKSQFNLTSTINVSNALFSAQYQDNTIKHQFNQLTTQVLVNQHLANIIVDLQSDTLGRFYTTLISDVFSKDPTLTGHIQGDGLQLAPYRYLIPHIEALDGEVNINTGFTGSVESMQLFGNLALTDITINSSKLPSNIYKLNSLIELQGQESAFSSHFELGDGYGLLSGTANWVESLEAQVSLRGESLSLAPSKDINVTFSPDIHIDLGTTLAKVRGDINIDQGNIKIKSLPASAVSLSDDVVIKSKQKEKPLAVDLDVNVLINDKLRIDAFGLKSSLAGKLNLIQNKNIPLNGHGDLALSDATYKAMGQNLLIKQGQLIFTGVLTNPIINIEAIRDPQDTNDDVIAGLYVNGDAKTPKLTIFSTPVMAQQEALSYLVRGRAIKSKDGISGEDMAISMLLSSGIGQSQELVGDIGNKLGISNLSLNTSGSGEQTKVEVSGYIGPDLQIRYGVGVFDSEPEVGLRYELAPQFFVEFIHNTRQALDFLYQFSFD
ncbi:hypothetical protein CW748_06430 [Alteromonadales bacterium alter-6D02]|nr:hypothetical protein CW748_06430 [Alteromonadales bacterium alter-6D02]